MLVLQEILAWLGPCAKENQCDNGREKESHHDDSHMSKHREEEHDHKCSHTLPNGRRHGWGVMVRMIMISLRLR